MFKKMGTNDPKASAPNAQSVTASTATNPLTPVRWMYPRASDSPRLKCRNTPVENCSGL
jgi:hypothetical protein